MKRLQLILDDVQLAMARGVLEEAGIRFSVLNEQFSSLYPGIPLGVAAKEIVVADEEYEQARALLLAFFDPDVSHVDGAS